MLRTTEVHKVITPDQISTMEVEVIGSETTITIYRKGSYLNIRLNDRELADVGNLLSDLAYQIKLRRGSSYGKGE